MSIQEFCKYYRMFILKMTLKEFVERVKEETGEKANISSVSSFENNRSTNMKYITYYLSISNDDQSKFFMDNLKEIL